ncbi:isoleucine--tRNA ligase, partial [Candidatus Kaiserbacteria bacterium RIFCSPLOWO2_01_FULL_54_13]
EKELGFKHKKEIVAMGVAKFNERCRARVLEYASEWEKIIPRIGRWADMENAFRTMDKPFMESVWWVFKQLWDKGLVYEDYRSMHICPRCETTLSQQEVSEGYKDVKDIAVTLKFELADEPETFLLAWTTTPWTLPGNVALAVGLDIDYVRIADETGTYILAKSALERYQKDFKNPKVIAETKGKELVGKLYKPLFNYYANDTSLKNRENGWKIYAADFVTAEEGTGIAHEAPAFGADDWELLKKVNLPFVQHVNMDGTFKPEVKDFAGVQVKPIEDPTATDVEILKYLARSGTLFSKEKVEHAYPHCWRCDTPLLNYATSSWFVSVTKVKDNLLKNAKAINWSPEHIKEGRWGKWLEGARDWSISRQRFWASVMPVWRCKKCQSVRVFGSVGELEEVSGRKIDDLHKHIVDDIVFSCRQCDGEMHRVPDVLDTWFDSGSMPYGQVHYPFERKEQLERTFPAQFIAEGLDQTRAWFYYLHVLAGALFGKNAFQNVIVNGIVLAEDGKKMSKKLQNYPDPMEVVGKYGADALRFYLLSSPVMQAENLNFSEKGVDEAAKKHIGRLVNVLAFYKLYEDPAGNPSGSNGAGDTPRSDKSTHVLDRWILARLDELISEVTKEFEAYRLDTATRPIGDFIDDLSTWYLRRSRDRIKETPAPSAIEGLATLRYVLHALSRVVAPSMPFLAEYIFQAVKEESDEESVHLSEWPTAASRGFFARFFGTEDSALSDMETARAIVSKALEARDAAKIKVRQPLQKLTVNSKQLTEELIELIRDEVNVKEVVINNSLGKEEVALDTNVTPELREEGIIRDTIRLVQDARKAAKMRPGEHGSVSIVVPQEDRAVIERHLAIIKKQTNTEIRFE